MSKPKGASSVQIEYKKDRAVQFRVEKDKLVFDIVDTTKSSPIMHIEWRGIRIPSGGSISLVEVRKALLGESENIVDMDALSLLIAKEQTKLEISRGSGASDAVLSIKLDDRKSSLDDHSVQSLVREATDYTNDLFDCLGRGHVTTRERGAGRTEDAVSYSVSGTDRVMNTACLAAGAAVTIWPVGTMIAGPTFVGCLLWYAGALSPDESDDTGDGSGGTGGGDAGGKPPLPIYEPP
jgi:hypothetical protein